MPDWLKMLKEIFGEERAQEMEEKIRSGTPFSAFSSGQGVFAFPLQSLMSQSDEPVNWELAKLTAVGRLGGGHRVVSAADANLVREALSLANLRLDPVTTLSPPPANYAAWSLDKWLDASADVWKMMVTPVAAKTAESMKASLKSHMGDLDLQMGIASGPPELQSLMSMFSKDGDAGGLNLDSLLQALSGNLFGLQFGQAWGTLAADSFGSTDIGLPVGVPNQAALVLENVEKFAQDVSQDLEPVLAFLATREAAYVRLYHAVPWLRPHVTKAITDYAKDINFDLEAMEQAMQGIDPMDQDAMQKLIADGVLTPSQTNQQTAAKQSLETILAIMEGWVDMVTTRCLAGTLPQMGALREMMNRRRASGGPAEKAFEALIGLELRPKRLREASKLWSKLVAELGDAGAEGLWDHPDLLPEESDFDDPDAFVARLSREAPKDEVQTDLEALLDGTLGYAQGLEPGADSEGDAEVRGENPEDSGRDTSD